MTITITKQPQGATLTEGQKLSLAVEATSDVDGATITYEWYKDGTKTGNTGKSLTKTASVLTDAGTYYVEVSDGDVVKSSEAKVVINKAVVAPTITKQPESVNAKKGDTIILKVTATGDDLKYQWFKDGQAMQDETTATFATTADIDDEGKYKVTVSNTAGSVDSDEVEVKVTVDVITDTDDIYMPEFVGAAPGFAFMAVSSHVISAIRKTDDLTAEDPYVRGIKKAVDDGKEVIVQDSRNGYFHKFKGSEMTFDIGSLYDRKTEFVFE